MTLGHRCRRDLRADQAATGHHHSPLRPRERFLEEYRVLDVAEREGTLHLGDLLDTAGTGAGGNDETVEGKLLACLQGELPVREIDTRG